MLEVTLLLIIILILGLMAIGYVVEVGGILAWIGWGAVLVCCALFFYFSGMYPKIRRRKPKREARYTPFASGPPWSGPSDAHRFLRGRRGQP